ncbi:MAG: peptide deformylase [Nitrospinota bacterium]
MLLDIKVFPHPVLRESCRRVTELNEEIRTLIANMIETMNQAPGVGLAAPQVGSLFRIVVINNVEKKNDIFPLINPEIVSMEGSQTAEEGCLSIPGVFINIKRARSIWVRALSLDGAAITIEAEGRTAQIVQHEMDHLDGVLFWDRTGKARRDLLKKKFIKKMRAGASAA